MTEESNHYMGHPKVHKSPTTSLDPEPGTKDKHTTRPGLPQSNPCNLLCQSKARREISPCTRTLMAALWETAIRRRTWQGMLGPDYWNAGTSLLFGAGFRP
jgi:hypothetical protein